MKRGKLSENFFRNTSNVATLPCKISFFFSLSCRMFMERIHQSAAWGHSSIKHCRMQGTCFQRWFWSIEFFWWAILPPILLSSELLYWIHLFADVSPVFSEIQNDFKSRHILDGTYKVLKVSLLSWVRFLFTTSKTSW